MAKRRVRRRTNTSRRRAATRSTATRRRRRSNPVARRRTRRRNASPRRRTYRRRRRNPQLFGSSVSAAVMTNAVFGGLVGVAASKLLLPMLPPSLRTNGFLQIVSSAAVAFLAGFLAAKVNRTFGDAVFFGGLMQTGSIALNTFIPSLGSQLALRGRGSQGMGYLVDGAYPVPQNPIHPQGYLPAASTARMPANGLQRAFGSAF